jgi:hypothetical protein
LSSEVAAITNTLSGAYYKVFGRVAGRASSAGATVETSSEDCAARDAGTGTRISKPRVWAVTVTPAFDPIARTAKAGGS